MAESGIFAPGRTGASPGNRGHPPNRPPRRSGSARAQLRREVAAPPGAQIGFGERRDGASVITQSAGPSQQDVGIRVSIGH